MGAVEQGLLRQGLRYSLASRLIVVGTSSSASLLLVAAPSRPVTAALVVALNVWNICYAAVLLRAPDWLRWVVPLDVAVLCGVCLAQVWTVRPDPGGATTWVLIAMQITLVTYPWQIGWPGLVAATTAIVGAYQVGATLVSPDGWSDGLAVPLWTSLAAALSWGSYRFVRRSARAADRVVERAEQLRRAAQIAAARRTDEREYLAALHDTASATLLMVGSGVVAQRETWLAAQARRDLQEIGGSDPAVRGELDLLEVLREVVRHTPVRVSWSAPDTLRLAAVDAVSLSRGVREALTNVVRHAGTDHAEIRVRGDVDGVTVQVVDEGRGFDPGRTSDHRYGLTRSLVERMARTGGSARIDSTPGRGTTVTMTCPWSRPEPQDDDAAIIAVSFQQGVRWAAVVVTLVILLLLDLPTLLSRQYAYFDVRPQLAAWAGLFAVTLVVAAATWWHRPLGRWRWPLLALVFACAALGAVSVRPAYLLDPWSRGNAGWQVVLIMLDTRLAALVAVLLAQYAMTWVQVTRVGSSALNVADAVNTAWLVLSYQLMLGLVAAALRVLAGRTARVARADEQLRTSEAVARHLHDDRTRRLSELAATTVPLLQGLASGELDPGQESVRRRCAAEAARMRRLFAEDTAMSDPLAHELRACIETAEHHGVSVSFAECGTRPTLPAPVRRRLTEPAIAVLATARGAVRLTVAGTRETVTVSVIAECPPLAPMPDSDGVHRSTVLDGNRQWIQTTWRGGS